MPSPPERYRLEERDVGKTNRDIPDGEGHCHQIFLNKNIWLISVFFAHSDILHPNRANISKDELREKLGAMYKAQKDQISVFGLRTQFGGGKTTGFALVYDSPEAMKKFEPTYRLIRVGQATKVERASRQQRAYPFFDIDIRRLLLYEYSYIYHGLTCLLYRQAAQEPTKDAPRHGEDQGCQGEEGEINGFASQPCISSDRWGKGCGVYLPLAAAAAAMRVRPPAHRRRREGRGVDGSSGSARGREASAFMMFPPTYTSMKSMVFWVSDQKKSTSSLCSHLFTIFLSHRCLQFFVI